MPYAGVIDLLERFGESEVIQLTDRAAPLTGDVVEDVAEKALADASAEIDSYIGVVYTLPLPSVPDVLLRVCCDIVRYRLYDDKATDEVSRRYKEAVRWLEQIAQGKVSLGFSDTPPTGVAFTAPARIMQGLDY